MFNKSITDYYKLFTVYLQVVIQSLVINIILFFIGKKIGGFSEFIITPRGQSLNLMGIITPTIIFPLFGVLFFVLLAKFSSQSLKYFKISSYVFLLFMFAGPLGLENATTLDKIILEIMHLVVGIQFIMYISHLYDKIVINPVQIIKPVEIKKPRVVNL